MSLMNAISSPANDKMAREISEEIRDELEFHLAMMAEENQRQGMSEPEAHAAALRRFGDVSSIQSACQRVWLTGRRVIQLTQLLILSGLFVALAIAITISYRSDARRDVALNGLQDSVTQLQQNLSVVVDRAPPVVIETFPAADALDVDPTTKEIRVTFSKLMMDESWSWCETEFPFPESIGPIRFADDGKTCVMPVKLEPDTEYVVRLNTPRHGNFKDTYGRSAEPFLLCFKTADIP